MEYLDCNIVGMLRIDFDHLFDLSKKINGSFDTLEKSKLLDEFDRSEGVSILVVDDKHRSVGIGCCFLIAGLMDNFRSIK